MITTVIFFPISFLTGYFGMNFHTEYVKTTSEWFYWTLALPILVGTHRHSSSNNTDDWWNRSIGMPLPFRL